ncbi:SLC13 family permease [Shumkonia mesophila]|uniref:SLC13 family permease n=1 Tax=Shumkonia mesophila TaxID=2838854 RepID=UPI002934513E|nr:SLC13 family permease [Shumkonia mesophila]
MAGIGIESLHMWAAFAIILGALALFATERLPMEVTSIGVVCALLLVFGVFPVPDGEGGNRLDPTRILEGFANPALITVLALLVVGQGIVRTGLIDHATRILLNLGGGSGAVAMALVLGAAAAFSAFLNNTPVVVMFIPIMQALAGRFRISVSKLMIPLSFAAILGGMTTLVGSSTNLLVSGALVSLGEAPLGFFDFTVPGVILAGIGYFYILLAAPRLLPDRASLVQSLLPGGGKQFIAQLSVSADSHLVGKTAPGGIFADLGDMTVRVVQRDEEAFLPPFEGVAIRPGDVLVVAATRKALTEVLTRDPGLLDPDLGAGTPPEEDDEQRWRSGERVLAEVMVVPASPMIGQTLAQIGFRYKTHCIVLGIQRRSRMIRMQMTDIRLAAGDVLLVQGRAEDVDGLKRDPDVVLIAWSAEMLPKLDHAKRAALIFLAVIGVSASGMMPIVTASLIGAVAMVATGVLNVRQALRAVDARIMTAIGASLAMGVALQESGGASFLAQLAGDALGRSNPALVLSALFLIVAAFTNVISNNACAVLFTPIAVSIAAELHVSPAAFAVAVVFAANCSFASPLGYQTNLLVMGPGHNRFLDFARAGAPLIVLLWAASSLVLPWYYGF